MEAPIELWKQRLTVPAYRVGEAAIFAKIAPQTITSWEGSRSNKNIAVSRRVSGGGISFLQLIEIAVVADLRRAGVKLERIRKAREYFAEKLDSVFPFAKERFKTDGVNILLEYSDDRGVLRDRLIASDESGQLVWTEFLHGTLKEFNYHDGTVSQWFLDGLDSEVVIDPRICFGAPSVRGVMTRAIKNEWAANQSVETIADDFDLTEDSVAAALRFEKVLH